MRDSENFIWVIAAVLVLGIAGGLWYLRTYREEAPAPVEAPTPPESSQPATPHYPVPEPATDESGPHDLVPLPPLDDSDSYFRIALVNLFGDRFGELLADSGLIEKSLRTSGSPSAFAPWAGCRVCSLPRRDPRRTATS